MVEGRDDGLEGSRTAGKERGRVRAKGRLYAASYVLVEGVALVVPTKCLARSVDSKILINSSDQEIRHPTHLIHFWPLLSAFQSHRRPPSTTDTTSTAAFSNRGFPCISLQYLQFHQSFSSPGLLVMYVPRDFARRPLPLDHETTRHQSP